MLVSRRTFTGIVASASLTPLWPGTVRLAAQATSPPQDRTFDVWLGKSRIGQHAISFQPQGDGFRATTQLQLKVKLAFITLLDLHHQSQELWQNGRLVELKSHTNEDGQVYEMSAAATPDGIRVESPAGTITAPADSRSSNDIWDVATLDQRQLIDAQNGGMIGLVSELLGAQEIEVAGQRVQAERYRGVTPNMSGVLWYAERLLAQAQLEIRGETIAYRLVA